MTNQVSELPDTALYYPFVHFRDKQWIKLAALYWPHIARMVPAGYIKRDPDIVKALNQELGLVVDVSPATAAQAVAPIFIEFLEKYGERLRGQFPIHDNYVTHMWPAGWIGEPGYALIWGGEISETLVTALVDAGVGAWSRGEGSPWLAVHPHLAKIYMSALADNLCSVNNMFAITDTESAHTIGGPWTVERIADVVLRNVGTVASTPEPATRAHTVMTDRLIILAIQSIFPRNIDAIPIDRIIRVRRQAGPLLDDFRRYMAEQAVEFADLSESTDPQLLKVRLRDKTDSAVRRKMVDLKKQLRSVGIDTARNIVSVRTVLPGATGLIASEVAHMPPLIVAGAASAVGVANIIKNAGSQRSALVKASPVGYLYLLNRALLPPHLGGKRFIARLMRMS